MKRSSLMCLLFLGIGLAAGIAVSRSLPDRPVSAEDDLPPRFGTPRLSPPANPRPSAPPVSSRRDERRPAEAIPPAAHAPAALAPDDDFTPEERTHIAVYENANRSVVNVTTRAVRAVDLFSIFEQQVEGSGSGSVLDQRGHILTNHHVIDGAEQTRVTLFNGESFDAELVGRDAANDIAVLRIAAPAQMLFPVSFGDSARLKVGQRIYAIGNPFGLERTMTLGIISSLNRSLPSKKSRTMKSIIQIDAALNRGNSGGPLLDSHARLIGMNTAIASSTGENTGVGFAIPINTIARVVPQLIENGKVIRADLGIAYVEEHERGLRVILVTPGGPAERAGLQGFRQVRTQHRKGPFVYEERKIDRNHADTIVSVDGKPVKTADDLLSIIDTKKPSEKVDLSILRDGQPGTVTITLGTGE